MQPTGMANLHRKGWSPWWVISLMICHSYVKGEVTREVEIQCPAYCKCTTTVVANNQGQLVQRTNGQVSNDIAGAQFSDEVISDCWIFANLPQLECGPHWKALHLQILSDLKDSNDGPPDSSTGVFVSSDLFSLCSSLNRLAIWQQSQITSLPQTVFRPLTKLTRLLVTVPTLLTLPDHFLAFLPSINYLMVKKCFRLTRLTRSVFTPCPKSLKQVELNGNGLNGTLHAGLFKECDFHTLWLNENQLFQLEYGSLRGLSRLHHLRLDHNHLSGSLETALGYQSEIQSSALSSTEQLRRLDLSFNRLTFIDGHLWSGVCFEAGLQVGPVKRNRGLCFLEDLNLSNNQLHWLGSQAFGQLPRLRKLLLDGNQNLYNADGLASLAVSLYTLREVQKIDTILLSLPSALNDANQSLRDFTLPLVHQLKAFNVCEPNLPQLTLFPPTLKEILEQLNITTCRGLSHKYTLGITIENSDNQQKQKVLSMNTSTHGDGMNSSLALQEHSRMNLYIGPIHCITMISIALIVGSFFGCLLAGCIQLLANRHRKCACRLPRGAESHTQLNDMKRQAYPPAPEVYDDLKTPLPVRKTMSTLSKCSRLSPSNAVHQHSHYPGMYYTQLVNRRDGQPVHVIPFYPSNNSLNNNNCALPVNAFNLSHSLPSEHISLVNWTPSEGRQPLVIPQSVFRPAYTPVPRRSSVGGSVYSYSENALPTRRRPGSEISTTPKRCQSSQNRS